MVTFAKPAYESRAGYVGGAALFFLVLDRVLTEESVPSHWDLLLILLTTFLCMVVWDLRARSRWYARYGCQWFQPDPRPWPVLMRSAAVRFAVNALPLAFICWLVHEHPYFRGAAWDFTRLFYAVVLSAYLLVGYPFHLLTLRRLGQRRYDLGDYALLTLAGLRALRRWFQGDSSALRRLQNPRVRKMALLYLVSLFFLTLMIKFFAVEVSAFALAVAKFNALQGVSFFEQYRHGYRILYHLIFVLDVGVAVIAYTVATRWLDNRTKSVDSTFYGWFVALLCYPPMNSGFSSKFIGYGGQPPLVMSEPLLMVLMALILACFLVYVWATMALGFRFSNLTNRGVVAIGPYAYLRHPSYVSKNLAWWLDNLQVLQSGWATFALAAWNWIYIQRALTEERHLSKDPAYRAYVASVPDRFIPMQWLASWRGRASRWMINRYAAAIR